MISCGPEGNTGRHPSRHVGPAFKPGCFHPQSRLQRTENHRARKAAADVLVKRSRLNSLFAPMSVFVVCLFRPRQAAADAISTPSVHRRFPLLHIPGPAWLSVSPSTPSRTKNNDKHPESPFTLGDGLPHPNGHLLEHLVESRRLVLDLPRERRREIGEDVQYGCHFLGKQDHV